MIATLRARYSNYFKDEEAYLDMVIMYLRFFTNVLSPTKVDKFGKKSISLFFVALAVNPIIGCIVTFSFMAAEWDSLDLPRITELIAIFFCLIRVDGDVFYVGLIHDKLCELVERFINDRKTSRDPDAWKISMRHSKQEFKFTTFFVIFPFNTVFSMIVGVFVYQLNDNNLPVNFHIVFFELSGNTFWYVNYIWQSTYLLLVTTPVITLFPLTFLLINYSCWKIDQTILLLSKLKGNDFTKNYSKEISAAVKKSYEVLAWLNDVQMRLRFIFLIEFSIMSIMLCMNFVTFLISPPGTLATFVMSTIQIAQFFVFCWLGQRVVNRIDLLIDEVYNVEWYDMSVKDRKGLLLMLVMAQNMRGFDGIFNKVNMQTFMSIFQAAYSLLMFFKSGISD